MNSIQAFLDERNRAFESLNLEWARKYASPGADDHTLLTSLHKARYEVPSISLAARRASRQWLQQHGYSRQGAMPWPTPEQEEHGGY